MSFEGFQYNSLTLGRLTFIEITQAMKINLLLHRKHSVTIIHRPSRVILRREVVGVILSVAWNMSIHSVAKCLVSYCYSGLSRCNYLGYCGGI